MKIRIATKAWNYSVAAKSRDDARVGIGPMWVEIDGHRHDEVLSAVVETGESSTTVVTVKFIAAAEMVLLNADGQIIPQPEEQS